MQMLIGCVLLAVLSIWDYPERHVRHDQLRRQFVAAMREGDTSTMEETCRKGVALLPDDPTWHYNLACSLAYFPKRSNESFDELEKAIDLGFRDVDAIAKDQDLKRLEKLSRYAELIEYARQMQQRPLLLGPMVTTDATGIFGRSIALGEQNLSWNFDVGCFVAKMKLAVASTGGNVGDLYVNRDANHSLLDVSKFPGITVVSFDQDGRSRGMDLNIPNTEYPYPVFGNSSRAFTAGNYWRSLPRAATTIELGKLGAMARFYLSNQTWVFPANADIAPVGTNGDVFASITPYWLITAGRSYSDLPYLRAALEVSRSLKPKVKAEIVKNGMLAPTIQTLIRKSLKSVTNEVDYLSYKAHPTALPVNGVDLKRLVDKASKLTEKEVPPLAAITVLMPPPKVKAAWPELTYASACAWAFVLRSDEEERTFFIKANGASEFAFVHTHGSGVQVKVEKTSENSARVILNRNGMSPTNRVDIAVFGRNPGTEWGAPSYISFARMDPAAPYSDPVLTPLAAPSAK